MIAAKSVKPSKLALPDRPSDRAGPTAASPKKKKPTGREENGLSSSSTTDACHDAHFDQVKAFLRKWTLDLDNTVDLMRCSMKQQREVIETFAPTEETRNMNVAFHMFVTKLMEGSSVPVEPLVEEEEIEEPVEEPVEPMVEEEIEEPVEEPLVADDDMDPVEAFGNKWNLNHKCMERLESLPPDVQKKVIETFSPRGSTSNVNNLFMAFARSRAPQQQPPPEFPEEDEEGPGPDTMAKKIEDFADRHGLSNEAIDALVKVPWQLQEDVIKHFSPRDNSRKDVNNLFLSFLRTRRFPTSGRKAWRKGEYNHQEPDDENIARTPPPEDEDLGEPLADEITEEEVEDFIAANNIDAQAADNFRNAIPEVQARVIARGELQGVRNPSAMVSARIKEAQKDMAAEQAAQEVLDKLDGFISQWNLDENAANMLQDLHPDVQDEVMSTFQPHAETSNVSQKFISYAKSRAARRAADPVDDFARKWNLDDTALHFLQDLRPHVQEEVMNGFQPRSETSDVSKVFMSYAKSRAARRAADPVDDFARKWNLDDNALHFLQDLRPHVQEEVMKGFQPRSETSDVSRLFVSYAKSRDAKHYKDPVDDFSRKWSLDDDATNKLRNASKEVQEDVMYTFNPPGSSSNMSAKFVAYLKNRERNSSMKDNSGPIGAAQRTSHYDRNDRNDKSSKTECRYYAKGFCKDGDSCRFYHSDPIAEFKQKWKLDEDAVGRLRDLPRDQQDDIMNTFAPRGDWHDNWNVNAKFISFIRSRSWNNGDDSGQPWKRQRNH